MRLIIFTIALWVFTANAIHELSFKEVTQIWQQLLLQHIDECVKKTGVDRVLAERLLPYGEYVDDDKLKCFTKCVGVKMQIVGKDATANQEYFLDTLQIHDPKLREKIRKKCFEKISHEDTCVQVFKTSECVYFIMKKYFKKKGINENKIEL